MGPVAGVVHVHACASETERVACPFQYSRLLCAPRMQYERYQGTPVDSTKGVGLFFVAHGLDASPGRQHTGQPAIGWACGPAGPPVTFLNLSENGHMISRPETRDYGND